MRHLMDVQRSNALMRGRCVDLAGKAVLLSKIAGSEQEDDLTLPANLDGIGRIRHFRRTQEGSWPLNPYPGLPAAHALGTAFEAVTRAELVQLAGCGMRCWYCFVPFSMLAGSEKRSRWLTAEKLVELYLALPDRPNIMVLSGGSPDVAPEWISWVLQALDDQGVGGQTFLWSDDNLSSTQMLEPSFVPHLAVMRRHQNYGKVVCLKGYDAASFSFNTQVAPEGFERQLDILAGYLGLNLNIYGYITLTTRCTDGALDAIRRLMDRIQAHDPTFLSRLLPLRVSKFGAMLSRLNEERAAALACQDTVLNLWLSELSDRQVVPLWQN